VAKPRRNAGTIAASYGARLSVALICLYILAPLFVVIGSSLGTSEYLKFPPDGLTSRWYGAIGDNPKFVDSFITSVQLAVACVVVSLLITVPAAYAIARFPNRLTAVLEMIFMSPLMLPAIVIGLGFLFVLSASGWSGTFLGALMAHVIIASPFILRSAIPGIKALDPRLEEASRSLGAGTLMTFRRVTLPGILPSVIAGAVFAFVISFDEAVVTLFLVGPEFQTLPVTIFTYLQYSNDPVIAAVSSVLVLIGTVMMLLALKLTGRDDHE